MAENDQTQTDVKQENALAVTEQEPYQLKKLLEEDGCFDIVLEGNVAMHLTLDLLNKLVSVRQGDPPPNNAELLMFANMVLSHRLNPYMKECWLVRMKGKYEPVVSAQAKLRKARACVDYGGFKQGWITEDGIRHEAGRGSTALPEQIVGVWGEYLREGQEAVYLETFTVEFKKEKSPTWSKLPLTMIQKVNRDHGHKLMYPEMFDGLYTENEIKNAPLPSPDCKTPKRADRKPVKNTSNSSPSSSESDAAGTDAGGSGSVSDEATIRAMVDGCTNSLRDVLCRATGEIGIPPEKLNPLFCILYAWVNGGDEADYTTPADFTIEGLTAVNKQIEDGLPDEILDAFVPDTDTEPISEEEAEKNSIDKLETYYRYKCNKCGEAFNTPTENSGCPACLQTKDITDYGVKPVEESEANNGL